MAKITKETAEFLNREFKKITFQEFCSLYMTAVKSTQDCKTISKKLLQVKPELRDWFELNYKEYL